jgi:hypothetical protein
MESEIAEALEKKNPEKSKLVVLPYGISPMKIALEYCRKQTHYGMQCSLILSYNSQDKERLSREYKVKNMTKPMTKKKRQKIYIEGGIFYLTESILYMDTIEDINVPSAIQSIFVLDRHTLDTYETLSVVMNMLKQKNKVKKLPYKF